MLVKEGEVESERTKDGPYSNGASGIVSGGIKIPSSEDKSEGEVDVASPHGKKRAASKDWEERAPKRGKVPQSGGSGLEGDVIPQSHREDKPSGRS